MNRKNKNIVIVVVLGLLLLIVGIFICIVIFSNNGTNDFHDDDIANVEENNVNYGDNQLNDIVDSYLNSNGNNDNRISYTEKDVVGYFENMEYEIKNSTSFKEEFKDYFIMIVDFIFYDGEIKGYTFSELSDTAKVKIIAIALKIDSTIEEYVPGYKENISSTTGNVYTDIKEKLVVSYMDISTAICNDNENECVKVKDIFSDIKDYCKIGWDFIKGLFKSGTNKVKDWYEIYSGK